MNSDNSITGYFRTYEYLRKFVRKYKPLRSGMETQFSRRKKYYEDKYFNELRNFSENDKKHWKSIFYCRELEKLTRYYYCIDDLKNNKDFQLEINVELFTNLIKCNNQLYRIHQDISYFEEDLYYYDDNFDKAIKDYQKVILSFLLEKDIRDVKNIESLKSVYYVVGYERCTIFSVYKMIDLIYYRTILDPDIPNSIIRNLQSIPGRIYKNIHDFFKHADKIFIREFTDKLKLSDENTGNIVKSPMVGTFYIKPNPSAEPYVEVGKRVKKGDVICIVEAMKLMNEIESEFDGEVAEILVKDGEAVEYAKPLFRIV